MYRIKILRRLALAGMLLAFCVVVFGAYVRLTDAGLGCPDWPGCYGHVTPAGAAAAASSTAADVASPATIHVGKAWREMIHRYAASTLGLLIVLIAALAWRWRREQLAAPGYALALLAIVVLQGVLGMLTVTWLLKPLVVTLHLLFGMTTLALLWWLVLTLGRRRGGAWSTSTAFLGVPLERARRIAAIGLAALALQIALGGWTSSNYAAVSCPDFPTCQAQWWPAGMDYGEAFVLWRGLDINYTGGVLDNPARVAIHFTHRLGALVATLALLWAAWLALRNAPTPLVRNGGRWVVAALALQLAIGIFMVLEAFPLPLATGHNGGAALLLLAALALNRRLRETVTA